MIVYRAILPTRKAAPASRDGIGVKEQTSKTLARMSKLRTRA